MFLFLCFFVVWQVMMKEVGEIVFEVEENMSNPMRSLEGSVDQIFISD